MGSKTRLSSYCTKRANNGVNLVTSRKINTRLARPIDLQWAYLNNVAFPSPYCSILHSITVSSHNKIVYIISIIFYIFPTANNTTDSQYYNDTIV